MKFTGFEWDDGNWPKCARHGVSKEEIEFVLLNGFILFDDPSSSDRELRYRAIGKTAENRRLFIVFCLRSFGDSKKLRPISARYMHREESDYYEQLRNQT